ncbi:MAG: hypothetical protein JRJ19_15095, partial [Deltaproteobacteria bacterium]|nr:hypothetical protein [Deltaproteobacteria bacterium]
RSESVAFTLSVPKGIPPADGWPVVLYAHGTGGSSHSFIQNSVAEKLAQTEVTIDTVTTTVNFAVLGIEGVQHGDRRGGSAAEPNLLYFNFLNPAAAKYNPVQGAADNFQLIRLVESLNSTPVAVSGISDPIKLDSGKIYYFGHSQGSMTGPLFLAYSPAVKSAVLSGAGGNLIQSLLTKTEPVDIAGATRLMLGDPYVGSMHPMLNLFQLYFDPIDTVNYAAALTYSPLVIGETEDVPPEPIYAGPKNVFMSCGRDDHFSTEATMTSFSRAMAVVQVTDAGQDCTCDNSCDAVDENGLHQDLCIVMGLATGSTPLRANAWANGISYTAVLKMYLADGYDGHFVLFNHAEGADDYAGFLGSAVADPEGIPTLFP